jgi:hypothetical protein
MRLTNIIRDFDIFSLFETVLPDFILAFTFFTALNYAILSKRFGQQRPAAAVSASLGLALATVLIFWERANDFSIKDLGPIAIGFAMIALAFVMYQAIRQTGGSWSGALITIGVSIIIAKLLGLGIPIDPEVVQVVTMVVLITGILALVSHTRGHKPGFIHVPAPTADVRHDMSDLYRDRHLSKQLTEQMKKLRKQSDHINESPKEAGNIMLQLRRMLPAEGYLTEQMARLRKKAHQIRNGHIARLEETREVFSKLPSAAKKKASVELSAGYNKIIGIDLRLERLDKAVAENEMRIRELTKKAQQYTANYDNKRLHDTLKAAEKLQHHNSRLFKIIKRTEKQLSELAKAVAQKVREVEHQ